MKEKLIWKQNSEKELLKTRIFDVVSINETSPDGSSGDYLALDCPDWVLVIPDINDEKGDDFILVRQWRHALGDLTLEFPAGMAEPGEDPLETAARELREETGVEPEKVILLGSCNPNPALFRNKVHFCLATGCKATRGQQLDDDEYIACSRMNKDEVLDRFATGEFMHALMGTALALYLRHTLKK